MTTPGEPVSLLGLPDLTNVVTNALGKLNIPGKAELDALKNDIGPFISAVDTVTKFADKYGPYIPGAKAVIGPLDLLDKSLPLVQHLLNYVP